MKGSFCGSKKANVILDTMMWVIVIFVFIVAVVVGKMIFTDVNNDLQEDDSLSASQKAFLDSMHNNYSGFFDKLFLFVLVFMVILIIVASFMVDAHPVFFIISIILLFVVLFIGAMLSNAYQELDDNDTEMATAVASFPIMNYVLEHIVMFVLVVGFLVAIALYAKNRFLT